MRTYRYIGYFGDNYENKFDITVNCVGITNAYILLMAEAIKQGKHKDLNSIEDEDGTTYLIDKVFSVHSLLK